jgi:hypothetical protein
MFCVIILMISPNQKEKIENELPLNGFPSPKVLWER